MKLPVTYVWTHDSIGLGEDGPTHQPVEHLAALRAIPGLDVVRPADANETVAAWKTVLEHNDRPAGLALTRQNVPVFPRGTEGFATTEGVSKGGYVLIDAEGGEPDVILIGTGSEVALALSARERLAEDGIRARVVSMPCWELFDRQPREYRDRVLPRSVRARVAVEQASTLGWDRYVGDGGAVVGMHTFGASAPLKELVRKFGFTPDAITDVARERVAAAQAIEEGAT
jgi:transketolase